MRDLCRASVPIAVTCVNPAHSPLHWPLWPPSSSLAVQSTSQFPAWAPPSPAWLTLPPRHRHCPTPTLPQLLSPFPLEASLAVPHKEAADHPAAPSPGAGRCARSGECGTARPGSSTWGSRRGSPQVPSHREVVRGLPSIQGSASTWEM